ncbi:CRISPR system precrRNA processing endoribonuclease RAMP protein Cas6 [Natrarchaeobaculum sulfurireducens]|uniref:CRISPR-associated protein Cas6 n=1 Tax=Natrarchaeobaculum sulfurireducens TaxID=2044521 RepID=A0A346PDA6_9EURY|nr:CRISPR system precrRNA processing endoribonuclease RAMP protein Cas6 [Natrarchaeobaculum sulfurireducens]AXR77501.1 CRISPR-associated protein Cas6 [Natrarchaeobaculum sulfurireducens]
MGELTEKVSRARRVTLTVRPIERFPVPKSDGYPLYGALLGVLDDADESVSKRVHDSPLGSLHNSGLHGVFGDSDRPHHKSVRPDETYEVTLGIVDSDDEAVFQALVKELVLEGSTTELTNGTLRVESFESENVSHEELLKRASDLNDPSVTIRFRTATCLEEADDVTTMFPHRVAVFRSLLNKWNQTAPDELEVELTRDALLSSVIEKPNARTYRTHSVLVNRVKNGDGETRNLFKQGFTGECTYAFKDASESVQNAVVALALFGEYSGVGSAVARGCGNVSVEVTA